jgi:hypothetical protein
MPKRALIALVIIVIVIVAGMVLTMKRSMQAGAVARDPDATVTTKPAPPPRKP